MTNPLQFQSGTQNVTLTGVERVALDSGGSVTATTTTAAIAALASGSTLTSTSITTVGNGTLTAAALVGGVILRSGPSAAFTDTTATPAQIVTALGTFTSGEQFRVIIKNNTAFTQTLSAASNVTLPATNIIGPWQEGQYWATMGGTSAVPTVTFSHIVTTSIALSQNVTTPIAGTLNTVGAGTLTAALMVNGITIRGGSQSGTPFTDTTDVATAIVPASTGLVGPKVGSSITYIYVNNTNALATITGTTGIVVSQGALATTALVPAGMTATFLITQTAANTLTMQCTSVDSNLGTATALAGTTSGETIITPSAIASGTLTLPAVTGTLASTTGTNLYVSDLKRQSATVTSNSATLANVTGLSFTVAIGTYRIRAALSGVADGTGGIKYAFNYTTAVASALEITGKGSTAAALATQHTTTTTTQTLLFDQAAAVLFVELDGTVVFSTGGTVDIQVAQHAANATSTTVLGSYAEFTRIA